MKNQIKEVVYQVVSFALMQGTLFILLGVGIVLYPKLLNYLFSIVFVLVGGSFLYFGYRIGKIYKKGKKLWEEIVGK